MSLEWQGELLWEPFKVRPKPYTLHPGWATAKVRKMPFPVPQVLPFKVNFKARPTSYTLHPKPCTLHPTPHTLHPTPYTIHPTPYTLHHTPFCVFNFLLTLVGIAEFVVVA